MSKFQTQGGRLPTPNEVTGPAKPRFVGDQFDPEEIQRRMNAGQPVGGMKIKPAVGVQGAAPVQQPAKVGVSNPYTQNIPTPGHSYSDSEASHLDVPKGWGTGEISFGNEPPTHIYSNPADTRSHAANVAAMNHSGDMRSEHAAHLQMLNDVHGNANALMNEYYAGRAGMPEIADAHAAMGQYANSLLANDAQVHTAEMGRQQHFDPRQDPAYMAAAINQMNAGADRDRAEADNHNPASKLGVLKQLIDNPDLAEGQGAMASGDMEAMRAAAEHQKTRQQIGVSGVNTGNVGGYIGLPENKTFGDIVHNQELHPLERLARLLDLPGSEDPNSGNRHAIESLVPQLYPTEQAWNAAYDSLPTHRPTGFAAPFIEHVLGPVAAMGANLAGRPIGTGHWRENADLYDHLNRAMTRTGYYPSYNKESL